MIDDDHLINEERDDFAEHVFGSYEYGQEDFDEEDGLEDIDDRYEEDEDGGEDEMNFNHSIILIIYSHYSI